MARTVIKKILQWGGVELTRYNHDRDHYKSLYQKYKAYTMIPEEFFLLNLDLCAHYKHVEGSYVECGVWRGGMSAAIAELVGQTKHVHLFDSFEGLPPAREIDGQAALAWQNDTTSPNYFDNCKAEESFVQEAMKLAGFSAFTIHRGWFENTLPLFRASKIAMLRLDGDWYDSVLTCLRHLYPGVVEGGIIILDDYYTWDGCAKAVHDYLAEVKSPSRIYQWKNQVAFILKQHE